MHTRTPLIVANLKMHPLPTGWNDKDSPYRSAGSPEVVVCPTAVEIPLCMQEHLIVGAQCGCAEEEGACTGEVSMRQLKLSGCTYVLCGHSDRRKSHGETDAQIGKQVQAAVAAGLIPILCIGETAAERDAGKTKEVAQKQLSQITTLAPRIVIAYEPVWAIGSGKSASPAEAQELLAFIRSQLPPEASRIRLLYGGSVTPANAKEFLQEPDIDGLLVGKACLDLKAFADITS